MQKLEILIEENSFGRVRPLEVIADIPVSTLVPALVHQLGLPQTDLFGKKLVYMLRQVTGGHIIPEYITLADSGVQPGATLALDSFVLDGTVATLAQRAGAPIYGEPELYSGNTIADETGWMRAGLARAPMPTVPKQRRWTRRVFVSAVVVGLAAGGSGLGYAAYKSMTGVPAKGGSKAVSKPASPVKVVPQQQPLQKQATKPVTVFPTTAKATLMFTQHQQPVRTVDWSATGMLASGADDAQVFLWGTDGVVKRTLPHPASVSALAWSPDGQRLVTAANTQVAFFDAQTGANLARSTHRHLQMVTSVAWAAQQPMQVVSAGLDMLAIVWDSKTFLPVTTYMRHTAPIEKAAWAPDGQTVATASHGGFVRVWHATNGQDLHGYYQDGQVPLRAMAFAPNGMQLAVGGDDGVLRFWRGLACGNAGDHCLDVPQRMQVARKALGALAWSPDGNFLAVGADDGTLSVWKAGQNTAPIFTLPQAAAVTSISWSPDSKQFATASGNTVTLWMLM